MSQQPPSSSTTIRNTTPMDQTSDSAESTETPSSTPQPSFNSTLSSLFGPTAPTLAKKTSYHTERMATYSCHIAFLKACRDSSFTLKVLRLSTPIISKRATEVLFKASKILLTERLSHYRQKYGQNRSIHDDSFRQV